MSLTLAAVLHPRLSARLDSVRADPHAARRHAGHALHRLRQYRRHQCAAHRPQGPRRRDLDLRHAQGHRRGDPRRLFRRPRRRDAGRRSAPFSAICFRSGSKFKGGKGVAVYIGVLIGLFWPAAVVFCVMWLATAFTSRYSSLSALVASFVTPIFLWWFGHPALASLFVVLTAAVVLHAPRKHQAVAGRDRGADRAEVILSVAPARLPRSARPPARRRRRQTAR